MECLSACWGEPVCHWCDSHHQRRTSTPCRAVRVCCWTAHPSHTSSMKATSEGMLQKTQAVCWVCFLCLPQLLAVCDGSTSSSPLAQHGELRISGSLPEHIFVCHSQGLGPEQFHGTCHCPRRAGPPRTSCAAWQRWSAAKWKSHVARSGKWVITGKAL